jgi:hypothetical protein
VGSEFDRWFEVLADTRRVRIVMTAEKMDTVAVPSAIKIERVAPVAQETSESHQGAALAIG